MFLKTFPSSFASCNIVNRFFLVTVVIAVDSIVELQGCDVIVTCESTFSVELQGRATLITCESS